MNIAREKKKELLKRLEKKKKEGKPLKWVLRKKSDWRKYREVNDIDEIDEEEMSEIRRQILLAVPERKPKEENVKEESEKVKNVKNVRNVENAKNTVNISKIFFLFV